VLGGEDVGCPLLRHVEQIGLDHVEVAEHDVERRQETSPIGFASSQFPIDR
jgi:hypothetical protein